MINLPPLPPVPNNGRGRLEVDIPHQAPVLVDTKLGNIPRDYHSYSSRRDSYYTSCDEGRCTTGGREIWRRLPVVGPDGAPKLQDVVTHLEAAPYSKPAFMLTWGALAGAVGGVVGGLIGLFAGNAKVGALIGSGAAALAGGIAGLAKSHGDRVKLEWQEKPIQDLRLAGYYHDVRERTREECHGFGKDRHCHRVHDGYDHDFRPAIQATTLSTYFEPAVVHYKQG